MAESPNNHNELNPSDLDGVVQAAMDIARERRHAIGKLRKALQDGDDEKTLALARELCGLYDEPTQKPS